MKQNEDRIVHYVLRQEELDHPLSKSEVKAAAEGLLWATGDDEPLGQNWVDKLIKKRPKINIKIGRRQETASFNAFTPKAVNWYFDILEKFYDWIEPKKHS